MVTLVFAVICLPFVLIACVWASDWIRETRLWRSATRPHLRLVHAEVERASEKETDR